VEEDGVERGGRTAPGRRGWMGTGCTDGSEREKSRSEKESRYLSFSLAEETKREGG